MKKLLIASLVATTLTAAFTMTPTVYASDSMSLRICEYISVNDKKRLRSFLKSNKLKLRSIFKNMKCNGKNLLIFAAESDALDTGDLIIGKLSKKIVAANVEEIAKHSAHLTASAKKRIK